MFRKPRITAAALLAAGCLLTGGLSSAAAADTGYTYGFVCPNEGSLYYSAAAAALASCAEQTGDELIVLDAGGDSVKQKSQIRQLIRDGVDGIFVLPVNAAEINTVLEEAYEAQIPMVGLITEPKDRSVLTSFVGFDYYASGVYMAEYLAAQYPDGGSVLVLDQSSSDIISERLNGFRDRAKECGFKVAGTADGSGNREEAKTAAEELLKANKKLTAVIAGNDQMALGAADALREAERTEIPLYSFVASPELKRLAAEEEGPEVFISASITDTAASAAVQIMHGYLNGSKVLSTYTVDNVMIAPADIGTYGTDGWN